MSGNEKERPHSDPVSLPRFSRHASPSPPAAPTAASTSAPTTSFFLPPSGLPPPILQAGEAAADARRRPRRLLPKYSLRPGTTLPFPNERGGALSDPEDQISELRRSFRQVSEAAARDCRATKQGRGRVKTALKMEGPREMARMQRDQFPDVSRLAPRPESLSSHNSRSSVMGTPPPRPQSRSGGGPAQSSDVWSVPLEEGGEIEFEIPAPPAGGGAGRKMPVGGVTPHGASRRTRSADPAQLLRPVNEEEALNGS